VVEEVRRNILGLKTEENGGAKMNTRKAKKI